MASLLPKEFYYQTNMKELSAEAFLKRKEAGEELLLIDVRERWEFEEDNLGATCYPLGELPQFLQELAPLKEQEIIVHCKSGDRSRKAQKYLKTQGFKNVVILIGGMESVKSLI